MSRRDFGYTSLDPWTACLELLDHTDEQVDNILVYELRVQMAAVVDLRSQALLHALSHDPQAPITPAGLMASDLRLAVALAAAASALGIEALLVAYSDPNRPHIPIQIVH